MKTLQYWGTGNFQEQPYTGRIVTWTEKEKQTIDDAIATKLLAANVGFVLDNDNTGEVVTSQINPLTGGSVFQLVVGAKGLIYFVAPSGDVTGVSDRLALQVTIDEMPSRGGYLQLCDGVFYLDDEVVINKTVKIEGAGGGLSGDAGTVDPLAPTTIKCLSATANGLNISANGCTLRDFALVNTATPTAGAGILSTANNTATIDAISVKGFWNLLDLQGCYYSVTNCKLYDGVNYYLYIHAPSASYYDHGDMIIANNVLSTWHSTGTSVAQLRWESGGGLKCIGNKFNSGVQVGNSSSGMAQHAIQLLVADGVTTGSLIFTGNSISGKTTNICNFYVGLLGPSKTGRITNLHIVGNEIAVGNRGIFIEGDSAHDDALRGINIAENMFSTLTLSSIKLRYVRQCRIGRNFHNSSVGGTLIDIPDLTSNIIGLSIDKQHVGEVTSKDVVRDNRSIGNLVSCFGGGVEYDYTHGVAISAVSTWVQVFKIEVTNSLAGKLRLDIDARSTDTGNTSPNRKGVTIRQERSFDVSSAGVVTVATIGTDVAAGAAAAFVAVRYVVTTNWLAVEVQTTDVTNCVLWGQARLRVDGKLQTFHIGT